MNPRAARYAFGPFELDVAENLLRRDGHPVPLTGKAFALLAVLLERHGHLVGKQELLERVWPGAFVEEAVLSVNMAAVRRALGDEARGWIETVPRLGYRFVGDARPLDIEVEARAPGPTEAVEPRPAEPGSASPDPSSTAQAPAARAGRPRWAAPAGALAVVAAVVLVAVAAAWRPWPFGRGSSPKVIGNSVAVLPLNSLSDDPEQQHFADAMTDLLLTDLGRIGDLKVVSRQSVEEYAQSKMAAPEIARLLKVDCLVEGTVLREGQRVRINVQLIHGPTDRHLWAQSYDRELGDTLTVQEEVAEAIAREVGITIAPARAVEARHVAPAVYQAYLRGLFFLDEGKTASAVTEFRRATAMDPGYAPAYTKIASAFFDRAFFAAMPPGEAYLTMKDAALRAVELDGRDAEAHAWLATEKLQYEWDWAGAEREYRRSLELNPSDSDVRHMYAHYLLTVGRWQESLAEMDRAFENDPVGLGTAT